MYLIMTGEHCRQSQHNAVLSIPSGRQGGTGESSLETSVGTAGAMGSADLLLLPLHQHKKWVKMTMLFLPHPHPILLVDQS